MNLGFDFDKIFINTPPLIPDTVIKYLYKGRKRDALSYRIPLFPEIIIRKATHHHLLRPAIVENIAFLKQLTQNKNHKYYLISSRFGFLRNETNHLIKRYGFDKLFHELYFNFENKQPHFFKDDIIKKLNIHRYIDDDLPLLHFLSKSNPRTLFFWLNPKQNNTIQKNLFAISNIYDLLKK